MPTDPAPVSDRGAPGQPGDGNGDGPDDHLDLVRRRADPERVTRANAHVISPECHASGLQSGRCAERVDAEEIGRDEVRRAADLNHVADHRRILEGRLRPRQRHRRAVHICLRLIGGPVTGSAPTTDERVWPSVKQAGLGAEKQAPRSTAPRGRTAGPVHCCIAPDGVVVNSDGAEGERSHATPPTIAAASGRRYRQEQRDVAIWLQCGTNYTLSRSRHNVTLMADSPDPR